MSVIYQCYHTFTQGTFAFALIKYSPLKYNNDYVYPLWADGIGWILALSSMLCIPLCMAFKLYNTPGTLREVSPKVFGFFCAYEKTGTLKIEPQKQNQSDSS